MADLGVALTSTYPIPGGEARLYVEGVILMSAGREAIVEFRFPLVGRPTIVTGGSAAGPPFPANAFAFRLDGRAQGMPDSPPQWTADEIAALLKSALADRLSLQATGRSSVRTPVAVGAAVEVEPAKDLGVGGIRIPAVYGAYSAAAGLLDRQLYDVALLGDPPYSWSVVAPHSTYHRRDWSDFGIAHITDMHVARRIDTFRWHLLRGGLDEGAQRLCNWNDRFRGFVRYANYLHSTGILDVIVATGDLYDYMFEDGDGPEVARNNASFLRDLILGGAPGPDFPDVEELLVPIFMTPGNHDYRKHPYKLIFDATAFGFETRLKNFSGYNLTQSEAIALNKLLDPSAPSGVEDIGADEAARMVEADGANRPYHEFLADRGSYVVELGPHRIVMLNTAWDVGVVDSPYEALKAYFNLVSEDEATFVGGSPNCDGVDVAELELTRTALAGRPAGGLFILGLHAPLFNVWTSSYPYFLRETQRPSQPFQVHAFLARVGKAIVALGAVGPQIEKRHPLWFGAKGDHREPRFVKRQDSQDLLDYGVSRGRAEDLMSLLVGDGGSRAADVVLAGHTHRHNEFSVRRTFTGELAYYMDFYTQNPAHYYPVRFTHRWITRDRTQVPVTEVANVEVVTGAAPDAAPWPMPFDAPNKFQLQIPPYPTPLSAAADPRAWWDAHRPLVLQTASMGPLDNNQNSFCGFRVLSVKGNVIDKVHLVPMARLEASGFRLSWDDAVRPDQRRAYLYVERSRPLGAPLAVGAPSALVRPAFGDISVVYRDGEGRIHDLWQKGAETGKADATALAGNAERAAGDPSSFLYTFDGNEVVLYRGKDGHVHALYWTTGGVGRDALSETAGSPKAAGNPRGMTQKDGTALVVYRTHDGYLWSIWWTGASRPGNENLSGATDAPLVVGDPAPYINTNTGENIVAFRGKDGHIHTVYWLGAERARHDNLSSVAGSPKAVGDPTAYYTAHNDAHQVVYRSGDGHLHELWWVGINPVQHWDLTEAAGGAPPAASDAAGYYSAGTNTKHVFYRSADGRLNEIWWVPGGGVPTHLDITAWALAPLAADKPAAYTVEGPNSQHVIYRGVDNRIHEIRWNDSVASSIPAEPGVEETNVSDGSRVAAMARQPEQIDLFAVGEDGGVHSTWWNPTDGWDRNHDWFRIGGPQTKFPIGGQVAAVARQPEQIDLFVVGEDGGVYSTWWNPTDGWDRNHDWFRIGGSQTKSCREGVRGELAPARRTTTMPESPQLRSPSPPGE